VKNWFLSTHTISIQFDLKTRCDPSSAPPPSAPVAPSLRFWFAWVVMVELPNGVYVRFGTACSACANLTAWPSCRRERIASLSHPHNFCPMVSMFDLEQLVPYRCQLNSVTGLQMSEHAMCLLHCLTHTSFASFFIAWVAAGSFFRTDVPCLTFHVQLERTSKELDTCKINLQVCLESNRKLTRYWHIYMRIALSCVILYWNLCYLRK
jgi:hypothetical protein